MANRLSENIHVMWTGRLVCSPTVTSQDADSYGSGIGRKPFLWDNYPVNDYNRNRLFLGPFKGRDPELLRHLSGYVSNPMNEAEASKFALLTLVDYLKDPFKYDPERSWEKGVHLLLPKPLRRPFAIFSEHSRASFLETTESAKLGRYIDGLKRNPENLKLLNEVTGYLRNLRRFIRKLKNMPNQKLRKEMSPYLRKGDALIELGLFSLDLLRASRKGLTKDLRSKARRIKNMLNEISKDPHQLMGEIKPDWTIQGAEQESYPVQLARLALGKISS